MNQTHYIARLSVEFVGVRTRCSSLLFKLDQPLMRICIYGVLHEQTFIITQSDFASVKE